jgi:hypothetical protein
MYLIDCRCEQIDFQINSWLYLWMNLRSIVISFDNLTSLLDSWIFLSNNLIELSISHQFLLN